MGRWYAFPAGNFEYTGGLLSGVAEILWRETNNLPCPEDPWAPRFQRRRAPEKPVFISLYTEGVQSQVSGKADSAAAIKDWRERFRNSA